MICNSVFHLIEVKQRIYGGHVGPLNVFEKTMKSLNIVDCPNNRDDIVKERAVDKITRTYAFDLVFGPNSRQVTMSVLFLTPTSTWILACSF
jgi:hypothetical protein